MVPLNDEATIRGKIYEVRSKKVMLDYELAVSQSIALIRTFRAMKDYIIENQDLIGRHEFTQLKMEVSENKALELQSRVKE